MADEPQRQFDFKRGEQLRILRDCELVDGKAPDGKIVKASVQKAVIRAIDDHGRVCTASYDTLAREANISRRHCVRAIEVMFSRSQLIRESGRGQRLRLVIVWNELLLKCCDDLTRRFDSARESAPRGTLVGASESALGASESALGASESALGAQMSAPGGTRSVLTDLEPPPPSEEGWAAAAELLRGLGIGKGADLIAIWRERGRQPSELLAATEEALAIAVLPDNAARLTGPPLNAAIWFLERGCWPIEGVVNLEQHAERERRRIHAVAEKRRLAEAAAAQLAAEQARSEERERKYGPIVDALDEAALAALMPDLNEMGRALVLRSDRPWNFSARHALVMALARRDNPAARDAPEGRKASEASRR